MAYGCATVFQSALYRTNATVIETPDMIMVIDPTWLPHEVEAIREQVQRKRAGRPLYLLVTHNDFDHLIGCGAFPDAIVIASATLADASAEERAAKLRQIHEFDAAYYVTRRDPVCYPDPQIIAASNGQRLRIGQFTQLTFWLASGHTADGMFALVEPGGIWIAGDYLSDFELPFIEHSAASYEETLRIASSILHERQPTLLVPGHGDPTESTEEMKRRIAVATEHIGQLRLAVGNGITGSEGDAGSKGDAGNIWNPGDVETLEQLRLAHGFQSSNTDDAHALNVRIIRAELQAASGRGLEGRGTETLS
ncbi:MBL fold metallo-hydrolase [Paenibacillaceae bacterium]|nr:MBL fold metallo-hydrolase [Paenibacillaceae bacterium]